MRWFHGAFAVCMIISSVLVGTSYSAAVCNLFCIKGLKCVVAVPANCTGCAPVAKCVPQECNTECILPCPFNNTCVLTAANCCPVPGCRPNTPSTSNQS
ncbi:hypothetical protein Q1695_001988 [Nippostrongylus brasiliensis]|nr:hypothetical protein Q1695_001988 [Nippostrongylus brasiliensis]